MKSDSVRVIHIVPSDSIVWPEARSHATWLLEDVQNFFADQLDQNGHGPKTFEINYDKDGLVVFDEYKSPLSKKDFQDDAWHACKEVLGGGRPKNAPDIELCFFDGYSIENGVANVPGAFCKRRRCYLNVLHLKLARRDWLERTDGYSGKIFEWISPEPMLEKTLAWNGRGKELGEVSGASYGVITHEVAHAFGLKDHGSSEDKWERNGNLMGTGIRGFRGVFTPDKTDDRCFLTAEDADQLNESQFFDFRDLKPKSSAFANAID